MKLSSLAFERGTPYNDMRYVVVNLRLLGSGVYPGVRPPMCLKSVGRGFGWGWPSKTLDVV